MLHRATALTAKRCVIQIILVALTHNLDCCRFSGCDTKTFELTQSKKYGELQIFLRLRIYLMMSSRRCLCRSCFYLLTWSCVVGLQVVKHSGFKAMKQRAEGTRMENVSHE